VDARSVRPSSIDAEEQRPNFIVIVTDDQGWDDIGLHNPAYVKTPNIDRLVMKHLSNSLACGAKATPSAVPQQHGSNTKNESKHTSMNNNSINTGPHLLWL
jgi:hypothetical protein